MAAKYILEHIKRAGISADVCLASTTPCVFNRLESSECAQTLVTFLQTYPEDQVDLLDQCDRLFSTLGPKGMSHPSDTDLVVCIYLLYKAAGLTGTLSVFLHRLVMEDNRGFSTATSLAHHLLHVKADG